MKLLIVEDRQHHTDSAKNFFAGKGVQVSFTKTMTGFLNALMRDVDECVLSDVFFPYDDDSYQDEVPAGVAVYFICQSKSLPCVLITSGFHHGKKYQWIHRLIRETGKVQTIVGHGNACTPEAEASEKNWAEAWGRIANAITKK